LSYKVKLPQFEGPLDLLLHVIRQHELDIFDIPVAFIAREYAKYLELMKQLNLEVAGEFLVMAATLMHIKSRMLLPRERTDEEGEEEDPREALVRQLLEHQRFLEAADTLDARNRLDRDIFARGASEEIPDEEPEEFSFGDVSTYQLLEALQRVLERLPEKAAHEVFAERITLADRMSQVLERLQSRPSVQFEELFSEARDRFDVVITFLAMLELVKIRAIRIHQGGNFEPIRVQVAAEADADPDATASDDDTPTETEEASPQ